MIAQAYRDNESYDAHCFLIGPATVHLPKGFRIIDVKLVEDEEDEENDTKELVIEYENDTDLIPYFDTSSGDLIITFKDEGGNVMSVVNLGSVIGPAGSAATITIGTVSTGAAGSSATVTNSGTSSAAVFDFSIPAGANGTNGTNGADGITPTFFIGDGTGGTVAGSLYADYDNPYDPNT